MMRGPSYDDAYITRKMSQMPTFSSPSYGRPPMGGYMQDPYGYDYMPRQRSLTMGPKKSEKRGATKKTHRSLSPPLPYLWPELDNTKMERTHSKGWYRVDFGPHRTTETWYLPTVKDKLRFLMDKSASDPHKPHRASSMPAPPARPRKKVIDTEFEPYASPRFSTYYASADSSVPLVFYRTDRATSRKRPTSWSSEAVPYTARLRLTAPTSAISRIPRTRALSLPPARISSTARSGYPPMGPPPPRMAPRSMGPYYDYDYGYGGGYGAGYGGGYSGYGGSYVPPPRMSRYDSYLDDEFLEPSTYVPRYRPRLHDHLDDADFREKMLQDHVDKMRIKLKSLAFSLDPSGPVPDIIIPEKRKSTDPSDSKYSRGPRHLACVEFAGGQPQWKRRARARYPSEDPENVTMLAKAEYVDKEEDPEKEQEKMILKDRLSNRIHKFFTESLDAKQFDKYLKTYRQPGPKPRYYWKPKQYIPDESLKVMPDSSYRSTAKTGAQWEEPDTVFGAASDKKPFSKVETGSSFFSTYGYTNRKKDYVAEKVRDYYYFGDKAKDTGHVRFNGTALKPLADGAEEMSEEKKERRKKKKSKERDVVAELEAAPATPTSTSELESSSVAPASAPAETKAPEGDAAPVSEEQLDDEKERKRLEKKKRKAEREAAAKAAMEAELAALAAAEAELARLEAESNSLKTDAPAAVPEVSAPAEASAPAEGSAPAEPAAEVKSESAAEKSGEPSKATRKLQSATNKILAVGAFFRSHVTQKKLSGKEAEDTTPVTTTEPDAGQGGTEETADAAAGATADDATTFATRSDELLE
ncbi:uncharacterized abhydrolase domain-containing protein DDB_G0269086-like isoform X21 [Penaeus monodon]|uniref:uncharacterized abhydrolase domain-containing protein DDB_G0269086-like isoform X21 n=1 Tax=Penaeus monodon TaxID=6687 RepID=UPI0018A75759|nr:uncharacterized abhydrolase domain-containing protein DDB_G0269086-like isoform X21 [Penaeus monodon]